MNFEIFDDDFNESKPDYEKKLTTLANKVISLNIRPVWEAFVNQQLTNTRNFYLLKTALKVIENLKQEENYDTAVFNALSFMPDQTFIETVVMIVARFSPKGKQLAQHFNLDVSEIKLASESEAKKLKILQEKQQKQSEQAQILAEQNQTEEQMEEGDYIELIEADQVALTQIEDLISQQNQIEQLQKQREKALELSRELNLKASGKFDKKLFLKPEAKKNVPPKN